MTNNIRKKIDYEYFVNSDETSVALTITVSRHQLELVKQVIEKINLRESNSFLPERGFRLSDAFAQGLNHFLRTRRYCYEPTFLIDLPPDLEKELEAIRKKIKITEGYWGRALVIKMIFLEVLGVKKERFQNKSAWEMQSRGRVPVWSLLEISIFEDLVKLSGLQASVFMAEFIRSWLSKELSDVLGGLEAAFSQVVEYFENNSD